ncbi:MAG: ATP-binding cassette domain-containing protein [Candidatus Omnitrophica bacterium]|nr:ATP-binding cassette domain-containing protein [Candidatus Omnitrophota bacterium]
MLKLIFKHKSDFAVLIASVVFAGIVDMAQPLWLKAIIDQSFLGGKWNSLAFFSVMFFIFIITAQSLRFLEMRIVESLSVRIGSELRTRLWTRLAETQISQFAKKMPGEWTSLICEDVSVVQNYFVEGIASLASHGIFLAGILIFSAILDWRMLFIFALAPILFLLTSPLKKFYGNAVRDFLLTQEKLYGFLEEILRARFEIRQFRMDRALVREGETLSESYRKAAWTQSRLAATFPVVTESLGMLLTAVVLGFGGWLILRGNMTVGVLVVFLEYSRRFFSPLRELTERWNCFQNAGAAYRRIEDEEKKLETESTRTESFPGLFQRIQFSGVTFGYEPEHSVIENMNFHIDAGEKVAIVGPSGAGKSTLFKLLLSLFHPSEGDVLIDGIPVRRWNPRSLRKHFRWYSEGSAERVTPDSRVLLIDEIEKQMSAGMLSSVLQHILSYPDLTVLWISHQDKVIQSFPRVIRLNQGRVLDDVYDRVYRT